MKGIREIIAVLALSGVLGLGGCERVQVVLEDDVPRHLCSRVLHNLEVSGEEARKHERTMRAKHNFGGKLERRILLLKTFQEAWEFRYPSPNRRTRAFDNPIMSGVRKFKVTSRDYFVSQCGPPLKTGGSDVFGVKGQSAAERNVPCLVPLGVLSQGLFLYFPPHFAVEQGVTYQLRIRLESPVKSTKIISVEFYWVNARHNPVLITPRCWFATLTHCAARNATPFIHLLRPVRAAARRDGRLLCSIHNK